MLIHVESARNTATPIQAEASIVICLHKGGGATIRTFRGDTWDSVSTSRSDESAAANVPALMRELREALPSDSTGPQDAGLVTLRELVRIRQHLDRAEDARRFMAAAHRDETFDRAAGDTRVAEGARERDAQAEAATRSALGL
jgi:hypothetical protein